MTAFETGLTIFVVAFTAAFPLGAFGGARWGVRSRVELVSLGLGAVVVLAFGRALLPWTVLTPWAWVPLVLAFALGVVGGVLRWDSFPVVREGRDRRRAFVTLAVTAVLTIAATVVVSV